MNNNEMKEMEEISKGIKIENDKLYKGSVIKKIFENAKTETLLNPTGNLEGADKETKEKAEDGKFQFSMMLSGMLLFNTLENNLFEKEDK